jgi:hypothetical protein
MRGASRVEALMVELSTAAKTPKSDFNTPVRATVMQVQSPPAAARRYPPSLLARGASPQVRGLIDDPWRKRERHRPCPTSALWARDELALAPHRVVIAAIRNAASSAS